MEIRERDVVMFDSYQADVKGEGIVLEILDGESPKDGKYAKMYKLAISKWEGNLDMILDNGQVIVCDFEIVKIIK